MLGFFFAETTKPSFHAFLSVYVYEIGELCTIGSPTADPTHPKTLSRISAVFSF